jgi:hypothetical protein
MSSWRCGAVCAPLSRPNTSAASRTNTLYVLHGRWRRLGVHVLPVDRIFGTATTQRASRGENISAWSIERRRPADPGLVQRRSGMERLNV